MIQPVIAMPPHHKQLVKNLVDYCRRLDGTEVKVVPTGEHDKKFKAMYPQNRVASLQSYGLHVVSAELVGQPFIWLEPDSIPLVRGWVKILSDLWFYNEKHFLLSSDSNPPHDIVGGIGVYGPYTCRLVPYQLKAHGWDMFLLKHLKPLCAYTPRIQHSYGKYGPKGLAGYHKFPEDNGIIRKDTVIFHKDSEQGLIKCSTSPTLP